MWLMDENRLLTSDDGPIVRGLFCSYFFTRFQTSAAAALEEASRDHAQRRVSSLSLAAPKEDSDVNES